ncbi:F-box family protein, partial [Thalictrum thalictroides]
MVISKRRKVIVSQEEIRPWSNLPEELMEFVMKRLYLSDHIRLRKVCKRWRSMYQVPPMKQQPWLIIFNNKEKNLEEEDEDYCSYFTLYDTIYNEAYSVAHNLEFLKVKDLDILACSKGWLLLSQCKQGKYSLVLFNPFIKRADGIIELPKLKHDSFRINVATFTTTPTSSDCVYFITQEAPFSKDCYVSTCCLGDEAWITHKFHISWTVNGRRNDYIRRVVHSDGKFYCQSYDGYMIIFTVAEHDWKVDYAKLGDDRSAYDVDYLVKSEEGDILQISISRRGLNSEDSKRYIHCIRRLNPLHLRWENERYDLLKRKVLFLGGSNVTISADTVAKRRFQKNTIYVCLGNMIKHLKHFKNGAR